MYTFCNMMHNGCRAYQHSIKIYKKKQAQVTNEFRMWWRCAVQLHAIGLIFKMSLSFANRKLNKWHNTRQQNQAIQYYKSCKKNIILTL